ncbi:MAG: thiolase family protein [Caulobacteraceae bacterium]
MALHSEKLTCISGIGQSDIYRKPTIYPFELAVRACEAAIADAGLEPGDIDGASTWPGGNVGVGEGMAAAAIGDIQATLGLKLSWFNAGETAAMYSTIMNAIAAIAAGYCNHVLCWRAVGERWIPTYAQAGQSSGGEGPMPASGWMQFMAPYWAFSAGNWVAVHADRHMRTHGITREQMSAIPLTQRANAAVNPKALFREPLTLDEYMEARIITTPFCLFDCDAPCDGATAVVVSRRDAAKGKKRVNIEAAGGGSHQRMDTWLARDDFPNMIMHDAALMMWSRTDLKPKDVTNAHLYDGFTYLTMFWLEALGFCGVGESGAFIEGGKRIARDGALPLNTNGGQLSEGRMHGFGHLHEACLQLRGEAGARQVKDAKVAATGVGGGSLGGCLLLTRD